MSTEEEYTAERLDNGSEVKGSLLSGYDEERGKETLVIVSQYFDGASMDYPYPTCNTVYSEINPETLRQTRGKLFDRVKELEEKEKEVKVLKIELHVLKRLIHYPEHWDTMAYPTLASALKEIGCGGCNL